MPIPPIPPQDPTETPWVTCGAQATQSPVNSAIPAGVTQSILATNVEQQTTIVRTIDAASPLNAQALVDTAAALNTEQGAVLNSEIICRAIQNGTFTTVVEAAPELGASAFEFVCPAAGVVALTLLLGQDVLGGKVNTGTSYLPFETCVEGFAQPVTIPVQLITDGVGQSVMFTTILQALQQLLKCCNPCPETVVPAVIQISGSDQWIPDPTKFIDRIKFNLISQAFPGDTFLAKPDIIKAFRYSWIYDDGYQSQMYFCNYNTQEIFPDRPNTRGIAYNCYPGITGSLQAFYKAVWPGSII
jgi:hypothetical protein